MTVSRRPPFFRAAVDAAIPDHRKRINDALAKAMGIPRRLLDEPEPMIEARKAFDEANLRMVKAHVARVTGLDPDSFRITPRDQNAFDLSILLGGDMKARETCSTCGRSERLFERVEDCGDAPAGACRFRLRRVE